MPGLSRNAPALLPDGVCNPVRKVFPPPLQGGHPHDPDIQGLVPRALSCRRFAAFSHSVLSLLLISFPRSIGKLRTGLRGNAARTLRVLCRTEASVSA